MYSIQSTKICSTPVSFRQLVKPATDKHWLLPILDLMNYLHSRPTNAQYSEDLFPVKICSHDLYVKSTQYKKLVQMFVGSRLYKLSKGYRGQTDFLLKYIPQIQPILDLMNCLHSPPTKVNNFLNTYFHTIPM